MSDESRRIYSMMTTLEAVWRMNPERSLVDIICVAAAETSKPPESLSSCDDSTLLEGLYNLIEKRYK